MSSLPGAADDRAVDARRSRRRPELTAMQNRTGTLIASALGITVVQLNAALVTVAFASLRQAFDVDVVALQWTVNAYALPLAALLLSAGLLGDRFGARRVFAAGFGLSALAAFGAAWRQLSGADRHARVARGRCRHAAARVVVAARSGVAKSGRALSGDRNLVRGGQSGAGTRARGRRASDRAGRMALGVPAELAFVPGRSLADSPPRAAREECGAGASRLAGTGARRGRAGQPDLERPLRRAGLAKR